MKRMVLAGLVWWALLLAGSASIGAERLVVSSGHQGAWDSLVTAFGNRKGFFDEEGLEIEIIDIDTGAPTLRALVAGSVDVAVGVNIAGLIGAAMNGAPVKMISANFAGASDFAWYVKADSPIRSFKDILPDTTVAYSSAGASTQIVSLALMEHAGVKGTPVAAGNSAAALTQVMTGQIDIGYDGNGGIGIEEFERGEVRIIATGADVPSLRDQTVRGIAVTEETLAGKRDALARFLRAYHRTIDWMYADPTAFQWLAERLQTSVEEAERTVGRLYPAEAMQLGPVRGLDRSIAQAIAFKRIPEAPTPEQVARMFDIIPIAAETE